jgi:hypothetical protein
LNIKIDLENIGGTKSEILLSSSSKDKLSIHKRIKKRKIDNDYVNFSNSSCGISLIEGEDGKIFIYFRYI